MTTTTPTQKALFSAELSSIEALVAALPVLTFEPEGSGFWLWGDPIKLGEDTRIWRNELANFSRLANMLIALTSPKLTAIRFAGRVNVFDGKMLSQHILPPAGRTELIGSPVTLSARMSGPQPRPVPERALELAAREPRFERAASLLAESGDDLRELFKVMELIEKAHGGLPKRAKRSYREEFFRRLEVEESQWDAIHRAARPERHAEPHEDGGEIVAPSLARVLLQHALKLWLEREVPA